VELYLDTSQGKKAKASLIDKGKVIDSVVTDSPLKAIDKLLKKRSLALKDVEVRLNPGPGSFTGLRVGAAVVNTINWVKGKKTVVQPKYE